MDQSWKIWWQKLRGYIPYSKRKKHRKKKENNGFIKETDYKLNDRSQIINLDNRLN